MLDTYGNEGILLPGGVPQRTGDFDIGRMMYMMGGCLERRARCPQEPGPNQNRIGLAET